ncbi:MAG TPA: pyridoxal-dependent decarboxylase, partial [Bryobacteraceae bacterium]|nr:pyridoxal-dependent decarboxylase [Bryobacteraceae bacterium]
MLDDILDYTEHIRERPVWQPIPRVVRGKFVQPLPQKPAHLASIHDTFMRDILPYSVGNAHPGFMGWVHGGGTPIGMLAEMLAAGLNANLGGRDQIPIEVERQVVRWVRDLFHFPDTASGLFVTGTSMANLIAVLVARTKAIGTSVRCQGVASTGNDLIAYTSAAAHGSIAQAMDLAGLGSDRLRTIPVNRRHQIDTLALEEAIDRDRSTGLTPFFIAATAGTVDVGAIDDLSAVAGIAQREGVWFHVDGAYGGAAIFSSTHRHLMSGIRHADSFIVDPHKWLFAPLDCCAL